jgi:hypothetical protein
VGGSPWYYTGVKAVIFYRKEVRKGFEAGEGNKKWLWKVLFNLGATKSGGGRGSEYNFCVGNGYICVVFTGGIKSFSGNGCGERQEVAPCVA